MRILYAGDSPRGGAANYLLAVLQHLRAQITHLPPHARLTPRRLIQRFDAIILSDFHRSQVPKAAERAIARQVQQGTGLCMIGGWGSFGYGGWRGSLIEQLLPVRCRQGDDRLHLPGGAFIAPAQSHPLLHQLSFKIPPVICGLNQVRLKPSGRVVLHARPLWQRSQSYPLLVIDADPTHRRAAFTTDAAPHWCGGLVDWGRRRLTLPVTAHLRVEVGDQYVRLLTALIRWLTA